MDSVWDRGAFEALNPEDRLRYVVVAFSASNFLSCAINRRRSSAVYLCRSNQSMQIRWHCIGQFAALVLYGTFSQLYPIVITTRKFLTI